MFLIGATTWGSGFHSFSEISKTVDYHFGAELNFAVSDLTQYDQIGANGLIPIIRLGGITHGIHVDEIKAAYNSLITGVPSPQLVSVIIVMITLFLGYLSYAMVSRIVLSLRNGLPVKMLGIQGITLSSTAISFCAAVVVLLIASLSMQGFELVLMLNFGVFFAIAIPHAAAGEKFGDSFFMAFDFIKFNFSRLITIYLLSMGVAIAAQIGLLIVFMFPLSVIDASVVPTMKLLLGLFGVIFALFYQFVVCSRSVYEFTRQPAPHIPAFRKVARRVRRDGKQ